MIVSHHRRSAVDNRKPPDIMMVKILVPLCISAALQVLMDRFLILKKNQLFSRIRKNLIQTKNTWSNNF